jgi:hypothetical protein
LAHCKSGDHGIRSTRVEVRGRPHRSGRRRAHACRLWRLELEQDLRHHVRSLRAARLRDHLRYPQSLKTADDLILGETAGAADTARAGVGINRDNVILVTRYDLQSTPESRAAIDGACNQALGTLERL